MCKANLYSFVLYVVFSFDWTLITDLQIYAVTPIPDNIDVLHMDRVPDRIKSFYRVNNIRKFRYDRPFHKGPKDKENEFKVLILPNILTFLCKIY